MWSRGSIVPYPCSGVEGIDELLVVVRIRMDFIISVGSLPIFNTHSPQTSLKLVKTVCNTVTLISKVSILRLVLPQGSSVQNLVQYNNYYVYLKYYNISVKHETLQARALFEILYVYLSQ